MSGRSLGSARQSQDLTRSISGDLDVNWGPAMCGEDKQQEPVSTNVETKRERGENPQMCACCRNFSLCPATAMAPKSLVACDTHSTSRHPILL